MLVTMVTILFIFDFFRYQSNSFKLLCRYWSNRPSQLILTFTVIKFKDSIKHAQELSLSHLIDLTDKGKLSMSICHLWFLFGLNLQFIVIRSGYLTVAKLILLECLFGHCHNEAIVMTSCTCQLLQKSKIVNSNYVFP